MSTISIARIVTVPEAFVHIKPFLHFLRSKDTSVALVSSSGPYEQILKKECDLDVYHIEISREINIKKDLVALWQLINYFRKYKFDIIHSSTPKAGLLVALAGLASPKSVRIHTFTGQRWATLTGFLRTLLKWLDRLIIILNTKCYADSESQIKFLISEGVARPKEVQCLHKGSYGGIDILRFSRENFPNARTEVLAEIKADNSSLLVLFVGRINKEKGVEELVRAFVGAQAQVHTLKLILVGSMETGSSAISESTVETIEKNPHIFMLGFKSNPEKYFAACDLFCLPSYREGFGTVVLEAAASGLATVGTQIPGLVDAVVDGKTGILVPVRNHIILQKVLIDLALNEDLRHVLSANAMARARIDFDSRRLAEIQWDEYQRLLKKRS